MLKVQNHCRILKGAREKFKVTYKGKAIRITAHFSTETLKARKTRTAVFQAMKKITVN
jgi:hypothetical protein